MDDLKVGQQLEAIPYTAPDHEHLLYEIDAISNGIVMFRNVDTGAEYRLERQMVPIYFDRPAVYKPRLAELMAREPVWADDIPACENAGPDA